MHVIGHAASAVPFALFGDWWGAFGALAPDITWIRNEWRFRRSGIPRWEAWIDTVPERRIVPYRIAHSLAFLLPCLVLTLATAPQAATFWLGYTLHLALDLPTHKGRMQQQPMYPLKWKWPWLL